MIPELCFILLTEHEVLCNNNTTGGHDISSETQPVERRRAS